MAFDVWILCLIGSALAMCSVSLAQDLVRYIRRDRFVAAERFAAPEACDSGAVEPRALVPAPVMRVLACPSPRSRAIQSLLALSRQAEKDSGVVRAANALHIRRRHGAAG